MGSTSTSEGYVDYIIVNAWRSLKMTGGQMAFCNPESAINNKVCEYQLSNASQQVQVWNVTDPTAPVKMKTQLNGSVLSFKVDGNVDNAFVAFNGNAFCSAKMFGKVDNQNLHPLLSSKMVHPDHGKYFLLMIQCRHEHPDMTA